MKVVRLLNAIDGRCHWRQVRVPASGSSAMQANRLLHAPLFCAALAGVEFVAQSARR